MGLMSNYKPGPGRRSLGPRRAVLTRLPEDVARLAVAEADARGLSHSEYLAILIAQAHGQPASLPPRSRPVAEQPTLDTLSA